MLHEREGGVVAKIAGPASTSDLSRSKLALYARLPNLVCDSDVATDRPREALIPQLTRSWLHFPKGDFAGRRIHFGGSAILDLLDALSSHGPRHDDANGCRAMDAWPGLQAGQRGPRQPGEGRNLHPLCQRANDQRAEPFSLVDIRGLNSRRKQSRCGFGGPPNAPADVEW